MSSSLRSGRWSFSFSERYREICELLSLIGDVALKDGRTELALLSTADLGVESESSLADLHKRAKQVGLELCPAEVAPQLRLDYRNQPLGEALNISMEPVATHRGEPTGQDPGRAECPQACRNSDAPFVPESQSFLKKFCCCFAAHPSMEDPDVEYGPRCLHPIREKVSGRQCLLNRRHLRAIPMDLAKSDSERQRFESVSNPCLIASPPRSNLLAQLSVIQLGPNNL